LGPLGKWLRVGGGKFNPFRVVTIGETLPKVGPLGIGPTVGLNDSIPLGLFGQIDASGWFPAFA